jgi:hypothetical protein
MVRNQPRKIDPILKIPNTKTGLVECRPQGVVREFKPQYQKIKLKTETGGPELLRGWLGLSQGLVSGPGIWPFQPLPSRTPFHHRFSWR